MGDLKLIGEPNDVFQRDLLCIELNNGFAKILLLLTIRKLN